PQPVEQLRVENVTSTQVWLRWLVQAARHAAASQLRVSLLPADGSGARTALLNGSTSDYTFSSLLPGQMYTVEVLTQSGVRAEEFPSTSRPAGPLHIWTRPLPPQNLSLAQVTSSSALITWERPPGGGPLPDGYVVNVTRGFNTRSRFLPNGQQGAYTLRELSPGQHYFLVLTAVRTSGKEQVHSRPQHLAFSTLPMEGRIGRRERLSLLGPEPPVRLERIEETTNKISLALEVPEEDVRTKP
ncbi:hypothetical protein CRUP_009292, partial [Coryphaenoides rupestris]